MIPELEKPRVTELHIRMDCSGCMHKIKRAVQGVEGVYDVFVDLTEQKLTIIGRADLENIMRALKKIRKIATLISETEAYEGQPPPAEPPAIQASVEVDAQAPVDTPGAEPIAEQPTAVPQPELEAVTTSEAKDVEDFPMVHQYPHGYGYMKINDGPFYIVTHSYNNYRPSAIVSEYAYGVAQSHTDNVTAVRYYDEDYYGQRNISATNGNNNIASLFSDENPNACRIV